MSTGCPTSSSRLRAVTDFYNTPMAPEAIIIGISQGNLIRVKETKMKAIVSITLLLLLSGSALAQDAGFRIGDLNWLTGCWQSNQPGQTTIGTERWSPLRGGMMMGVAQTVKEGSTVEFEFLRIVQDGANILYIAKPSENPTETPFKLIRLSNQEAVFENPTHDFPQRVIYRVKGVDLAARIEGTNQGKAMGIDFPMIRVKCE
jgi:hypothetical protein